MTSPTMIPVRLEQRLERQRLRLTCHQREVDDREGRLQRRELEELVERDVLVVDRLLQFDHEPLAHAGVGLVGEVRDRVDAAVLEGFDDRVDDRLARDLERDLGEDDVLAPALLLDVVPRTKGDLTAAAAIGTLDARAAHDDAAGGEVRPRHMLQQLIGRDLGVGEQRLHRLGDFAEIVRRHARRHADGDARGAIADQLGEAPRQDHRLLFGLVVVLDEVDRLLLDVLEHVDGRTGHARFGVTHRGRVVRARAAEVALLVDQAVAHVPVLAHAHQRRVDDRLTVRVIVTRGVAADLGALTVLATRPQVELVHRVEDAAL
jgi:hypothetical protein